MPHAFDGPGRVVGDAAPLVVGLSHAQVVGAHPPVGRPGQAHHGGEPGQGPGVARVDAVGGEV
mgnify:CR=1 FL=1